jgi:hypothetical protein
MEEYKESRAKSTKKAFLFKDMVNVSSIRVPGPDFDPREKLQKGDGI